VIGGFIRRSDDFNVKQIGNESDLNAIYILHDSADSPNKSRINIAMINGQPSGCRLMHDWTSCPIMQNAWSKPLRSLSPNGLDQRRDSKGNFPLARRVSASNRLPCSTVV
jgi:hypothetical protein